MNERIKELALEAKQWANSIPEFWDTSVDRDMLFQKKFAELIVRECIDIVDAQWEPVLVEKIREHFGVEE